MRFGVLHHIDHYLLFSALYTIPVQLIVMCVFYIETTNATRPRSHYLNLVFVNIIGHGNGKVK
jgi:hypothetical protein